MKYMHSQPRTIVASQVRSIPSTTSRAETTGRRIVEDSSARNAPAVKACNARVCPRWMTLCRLMITAINAVRALRRSGTNQFIGRALA
ncbi:hypothetical protein [Amycolatopsis anabasis]|uniref:hypothetical protein n=1 Tax=Amycolatopsis anabasis TaxID=1840409 RepID=UPI00131A9AF1|nr:hypothetical protein [Amycolatopsis anabasis]